MPSRARTILLALLTLVSACASGTEVYRIASPDHRIDAVLIEHNRRGGISDFEVRVVPVDREGRPFRLAYVRGATRYPDGPGIDLRWSSEPPPAPNVQTLLVSGARAEDFWMSEAPPQFRSGTVLLCYAMGSPRDALICRQGVSH